ncbi:hypothetical protein HNP84_000687 [Thermocatellispora tengchongensis]|uniref:Uncharacterized protein n=1 Tax=Thermocatellispora tengchongensis TaxID=1073253 RepID=A0A840NW14_9ACTN|nr:hypothetical protein [Thermocatellispora tengchongensis]MBB5130999.1 hypothetical protein [Thermocatellispora tengchongensis]
MVTDNPPSCPACAWPLTPPASCHPSSEGAVRYVRCICGQWLVLQRDAVIGTAGPTAFAAP